ncbi:hypothetical protein [Erythrobacter ani]|uniref:Uncharacterized protein n=1 Tax=Erythrobacter ani TaxID=2827235 RepID=A0ABS6SHY0_9SPHN|nr:hypothetical protein [Erythrobacter ani]
MRCRLSLSRWLSSHHPRKRTPPPAQSSPKPPQKLHSLKADETAGQNDVENAAKLARIAASAVKDVRIAALQIATPLASIAVIDGKAGVTVPARKDAPKVSIAAASAGPTASTVAANVVLTGSNAAETAVRTDSIGRAVIAQQIAWIAAANAGQSA